MFDFGIKDIIDVFLVALMLYYIYRLMKESRSLNVFNRQRADSEGLWHTHSRPLLHRRSLYQGLQKQTYCH